MAFHTDLDKKGAEKDLKDIKRAFDLHKVPFFIAYGTLLGARREKDFIAWDDDMDLGIVEPIDIKTRKLLGWTLFDLGFMAQDIMFKVFGRWEVAEQGYNGNEKSGIMVFKRNSKVSIFWYEDVDGDFICTPRPCADRLIATPKRFYEKYDKIKFKGETFLTPSPIDDYLTFTYGDWKKPIEGKHADQYFISHRKQESMIDDVMKKDNTLFPNGK